MLYERTLFQELLKRIKDKEIIVITGMRRIGKTTILKIIYERIYSKNKVFFDMENPLHQKIFEEVRRELQKMRLDGNYLNLKVG